MLGSSESRQKANESTLSHPRYRPAFARSQHAATPPSDHAGNAEHKHRCSLHASRKSHPVFSNQSQNNGFSVAFRPVITARTKKYAAEPGQHIRRQTVRRKDKKQSILLLSYSPNFGNISAGGPHACCRFAVT